MNDKNDTNSEDRHEGASPGEQHTGKDPQPRREIGGRKGPDPTRFGDWEKAGRCIDF